MKLLAIVGSIRQQSYNLQLAKTIQERYQDRFELDVADIRSLPHYDQDEEFHPPEPVLKLRQQVKTADGVIVITPEYNWSVPGVLKNALDWMSRVEKVFIGKPVMTAGVSTGAMGTIRAQLHLRQIFQCMQANLFPPAGNEILISFAGQKFDPESKRLSDPAVLQLVDGVIGRFIDFVKSSR